MYRLGDIAKDIDAQLQGDSNCVITAIKPIQEAKAGELSFLNNPKYQKYLPQCQASAVIVTKDLADTCPHHALIVKDTYVAYAKAAQLFVTKFPVTAGIHASAVVGANCNIDATATIDANVVIGDDVVIGANTHVYPGTVIGHQCQLGENVTLYANVTLYDNVQLGNGVTIHSGAVLGSDGFGLAKSKGEWIKIPQLGNVVIGENTEIGANTTIDRGALGDTVIGKGVKLDNQIQIGHNVTIGDHTAIAACSGVSGSVDIGKHCMISGMVGFTGHFKVTDNVMITGQTMVSKEITKPGIYSSGTVMESHETWKRNAARFRQLDKMARRIKKLELAMISETTDEL